MMIICLKKIEMINRYGAIDIKSHLHQIASLWVKVSYW